MFSNYIRSAKRNLLKEKSYTILHVAGLGVGLATCFVIFSWVSFETSFDEHIDPSASVYRVVTHSNDGEGGGIASTYPMVRSRVLPQFPEVEASARIFNNEFLGTRTKIAYEDKVFTDNKFYYGDADILKVFPFETVQGDSFNALAAPNSVIITQSMSRKFFGNEDPVGKLLTVGEGSDFRITAVIRDIPENTHFHFDALASMQSHPWIKKAEENVWSGVVFHTYAKIRNNASPEALEQKLRKYLDEFPGDNKEYGKTISLRLQPVRSIHLHSNLKFELEPNGNITYIYLFVGIAVLVLALAIINYVNLATARHMQRFREVGVRRTLGASRMQLIVQFMIESALIIVLAIVLAFAVLKISAPQLSVLFGTKELSLVKLLLAACVIGACTLIAAGLVPALVLSNYRPIQLIKSKGLEGSQTLNLRKALLTFQFAASITLTVCTFIMYLQINFIQEFSVGYDRDQIVVLNISYPEIAKKWDVLKASLMTSPAVIGATAASELPTDIQGAENIDVSKSQALGVYYLSVDRDFFTVMGIHIEQGAEGVKSLQESDSINHFVLNESAIKTIGWSEDELLNKQISIRHGNMKPGPVIGAISDFHFQSLHHAVSPLVLEFNPEEYQYLLVKVSPVNLEQTIGFLNGKWNSIAGGIPFEYQFLDQEFDRLYQTEKKSSNMLIVFSSLALFIAFLGIFGLTSFAVQRRAKEIGLRKILGATVGGIVVVIGRDFLILLIVSFAIAIPAGYLFMDSWLSTFALKTNIDPGVFVIAGLLNVLLAALAVVIHSGKIAATKPVDTLRQE